MALRVVAAIIACYTLPTLVLGRLSEVTVIRKLLDQNDHFDTLLYYCLLRILLLF